MKNKLACVLVWGATIALAQSPQLEYRFRAEAGPPVNVVNATKVGTQPGQATYYYWVVVNYRGGSVTPTRYAQVRNAVSPLTETQYIRIDWETIPNATSYEVVRTTRPTFQSSCSACVVGGVTQATSVVDNGSDLTDLSVTVKQGVSGSIRLDNTSYTPRFLFDPPTAGDRVTWGLCPGADCTVADNITVPFIVTSTRTLTKCYVAAKTAPTGASIIIDVNKNGTSVWGLATKLVLAASATFGTQSTFTTVDLVENDLLTIDIEQIGSTVAGRDLAVTCTMH